MKLAAAAFLVLSITPAHSEEGFLYRLRRGLNPQAAATYDFQNAVAAYKHCTTIKPPSACEPERHIMDGYAAALAAINSRPLPNPPQPIR
jgi:hypothetical protein